VAVVCDKRREEMCGGLGVVGLHAEQHEVRPMLDLIRGQDAVRPDGFPLTVRTFERDPARADLS
jgi:hypothetical protein